MKETIDLQKIIDSFPSSISDSDRLRALLKDMYPGDSYNKYISCIIDIQNNENVCFVDNTIQIDDSLVAKIADETVFKYGYAKDLVSECLEIWKKVWEKGVDTESAVIATIENRYSYAKGNQYATILIYRAEKGDPEAQNDLGCCYYDGSDGFPQDYYLAYSWLSKAVEHGCLSGLVLIGECYYYGYGVEQNYSKAVKMYLRGTEIGDMECMDNLAYCYSKGIGVNRDAKRAAELYETAAKLGFPKAQYSLGLCYLHGDGVPADVRLAVDWISQSARNKCPEALNHMAKRFYCGDGVPMDGEMARKYASEAVAQGFANAYCTLALCCINGFGGAVDYEMAARLFKEGADKGSALCLCNYAICLLTGAGIDMDYAKGISLLKTARDSEDPDVLIAIEKLGIEI